METWQSKQPEKKSHSDVIAMVLENVCKKDEAHFFDEHTRGDISRTREFLAQTYSEVFARVKNVLEKKA